MAGAADPTDGLVAVGRIGPPRGVRGDVFVEPWTDAPEERFAEGTELRADPPTAGPLTVAASTMSSGKLVVHFAGFDSRDTVQQLRGVQLFVPAAERPALADPDEFYDTDLLGLVARDPSGREIGTVTDVQHAGGAAYLEIDVDGMPRLVPFVSAIVPTVDVAGGVVVVDAPAGLFEV